jgi:hypothetical protein
VRACLLAALLAGCDASTIAIDFDVPEAYEPIVTTIEIALLLPLDAFTCDEIVWGEVDDERIAASRLQLATVPRGEEAPLSGIPRLGQKVFYVQGLDAARAPVVAACADVADIDGDLHLELAGEPVASANVTANGLGDALPEQVRLVVTDVRGDPLGGVPVRWSVIGPASETIAGPSDLVTDTRGVLVVEPSEPSRPGPNALDLEVRWARPAPASVLGYREPSEVVRGDLPGTGTASGATEGLYAVGRIGPAGEQGLVALGPLDSGGARQAVVFHRDGTSYATATTGPIAGVNALGRLRGAARDRVVTLNAMSWIEIRPDGSTPVVASSAVGRPARRLATIGPCTDAPVGDRLLAWFEGSYVAFDDGFQPVVSPLAAAADPLWRLIGAGCVAGPTDPVRAVVYSQGQFIQQIVADMDGVRSGPWAALPFGVGFLPAVGDGEALLLGPTLKIDGTSIARVRLAPSTGDRLVPELVAEDDSTSFAISTAGGDVDGDGVGDVVSVLTFGDSELGDGVNFRLLVSLGVAHRGGRLVGLSGALVARAPAVIIHDFDEDGVDDVLVATALHFDLARMGP